MTRDQDSAKKDLRNLEKVRAIFVSMSKYINAKTIYTSNNPNVAKFADAFYEAFRTFFEVEKELVLTIEQFQMKWRDEVVYDNNRKTESIAFLFYKDGVGEITFQSSVKPTELDEFVDLIQNEIYNPSAQLDIVSRLWQSQFTNIFYRVFDECADGASGEGRGSGSGSQEQPLQANDHRGLPSADEGDGSDTSQSDGFFCSLGTYAHSIVERNHPHAAAQEKEEHVKNTLESMFGVSTEELRSWQDELSILKDRDKLLWLFNILLDFTQVRSNPSVVRDVLDMIERLTRYIIEEAKISVLIGLLDIQKKMACNAAVAVDFQSLPKRIEHELTNRTFLLSLGEAANKSPDEAHDVLRYFDLLGRVAVPGVCELLANVKDASLHKKACDTLLTIAGDDIMEIVDELNLDNPHEAKDAVYLVRRSVTSEIPPIIKTLLSYPDIHVREEVIEYLAHIGNEEAALLLSQLLEDDDVRVRIKTLAAVEEFEHPLMIDKVTALCFEETIETKSTDELERMFRTVGRLGGEEVLAPIKQMTKKKTWLPFGKTRGRQDKLLAITALRHIPGGESRNVLRELAGDGDSLVKTKALHVLKLLEKAETARAEKQTPAVSKETK